MGSVSELQNTSFVSFRGKKYHIKQRRQQQLLWSGACWRTPLICWRCEVGETRKNSIVSQVRGHITEGSCRGSLNWSPALSVGWGVAVAQQRFCLTPQAGARCRGAPHLSQERWSGGNVSGIQPWREESTAQSDPLYFPYFFCLWYSVSYRLWNYTFETN